MAKWSITLYLLQGLAQLIGGQQAPTRSAPGGPWRHRIQWENNGQVYSLVSTGSEYHAPTRSRSQSSSRVYVSGTSRRDHGTTRTHYGGTALRRTGQPESRPLQHTNSGFIPLGRQYVPANGHAPGPRQYPEVPYRQVVSGGAGHPVPDHRPSSTHGTNASAQGILTDPASSGVTRTAGVLTQDATAQYWSYQPPGAEQRHPLPDSLALSLSRQSARTAQHPNAEYHEDAAAPAPFPMHGEVLPNGEDMANDDPRNPLKNHRNSVLHNAYPSSRGRPTARTRRPPGTGYGTRYFQNGLPDLVPDPYAIQAGAYIQRMQMYALRCAAEENCLSRSAYRPTVREIDYRVLLRFPQKVKNQGTTDFLPLKPRHQWDWHSCHQHYHSMDAFSNYDLLDVTTGRKVAEGHKASFCLEDTGCDPGFRRRYACTEHTQGLSPGCHDTYAANIDCQWIDITDVPAGNYILKVTVNPNSLVQELDFSNNVVRCDIMYTGSYVQTRNCRITRG